MGGETHQQRPSGLSVWTLTLRLMFRFNLNKPDREAERLGAAGYGPRHRERLDLLMVIMCNCSNCVHMHDQP
jgi:hypothetical protein